MDKRRQHLDGGELIEDYFDDVVGKAAASITAAQSNLRASIMSYSVGSCDLAQNRDLWDDDRQEYVCGFNPDGPTDDTVLVGRIVDSETESVSATIVNYACHPTTLAWDNTLISPDFVGSLREKVESETCAPCIFIQGASGDIGPRNGFVGDVSVAEQNGRQLAFASLSALESLPPANQCMKYSGAVISGATIGTWELAETSDSHVQATQQFVESRPVVRLKFRDDMPNEERDHEERNRWEQEEQTARDKGDESAASDARAQIERIDRRAGHMSAFDHEEHFDYDARIWRFGDAIWVALNGEPYNLLQRTIREQFPNQPIVIGTLANGSHAWYLPDRESFGKGLYQEMASILAQGSLEKLIDALCTEIRKLID